MPRIARVIAPGFPHHVTQRGSRNQRVFFTSQDKRDYLAIFKEEMVKHKIEVWAYCLMDNHVHFIVVPGDEDAMSRLFREAHKRYARVVNQREGWRGHLWQERFHSFVMDEGHLFAAVRYVENNPVRAKLVEIAENYPWSSAQAHVKGSEDRLLSSCYLMDEIKDWRGYLRDSQNDATYEKNVEKHLNTGRPLGSEEFILRLEDITNRTLRIKASGRPALAKATDEQVHNSFVKII